MVNEKESLKICLLTYRGNPASGGQGVYIRHLGLALKELGHQVEIISGPPYPQLADQIPLHKLPGLDLYNPDHLFKVKDKKGLLNPLNILEYASMCTGGFPEPFTFGRRVYQHFKRVSPSYDIVHDNQCLSPGILALQRLRYPLVATIHHPVTIDRETELREATSVLKKIKIRRWYSFLDMQKRVSRRIGRIITVSQASQRDLSREYGINPGSLSVVMNGIDREYFHPVPGVERENDHLLVTNSADTPLKGLRYLLEAVATIRKKRTIRLTVIGAPKKNGVIEQLIRHLGLGEAVNFTGRIEYNQFAHYYARAAIAVIPSLYEGFGLPAGEAMSCGVPVISTNGGALPEVVGDAGIIVPPGDRIALENAILSLLDDPDRRSRLGQAGFERVQKLFTWRRAAEQTLTVYREAIDANNRA
ncbi:MAG: glycosyltransferase family 4 protein [Smithellaceae bacterium]|nr:glycosyltransferase family 4 protein [Smithellaceae bacterium]